MLAVTCVAQSIIICILCARRKTSGTQEDLRAPDPNSQDPGTVSDDGYEIPRLDMDRDAPIGSEYMELETS